MTHEQINKKIAKIRKTEEKARKIAEKLAAIRRDWEREYNQIKNTEEWENSCGNHGIISNYNFYDLIS